MALMHLLGYRDDKMEYIFLLSRHFVVHNPAHPRIVSLCDVQEFFRSILETPPGIIPVCTSIALKYH